MLLTEADIQRMKESESEKMRKAAPPQPHSAVITGHASATRSGGDMHPYILELCTKPLVSYHANHLISTVPEIQRAFSGAAGRIALEEALLDVFSLVYFFKRTSRRVPLDKHIIELVPESFRSEAKAKIQQFYSGMSYNPDPGMAKTISNFNVLNSWKDLPSVAHALQTIRVHGIQWADAEYLIVKAMGFLPRELPHWESEVSVPPEINQDLEKELRNARPDSLELVSICCRNIGQPSLLHVRQHLNRLLSGAPRNTVLASAVLFFSVEFVLRQPSLRLPSTFVEKLSKDLYWFAVFSADPAERPTQDEIARTQAAMNQLRNSLLRAWTENARTTDPYYWVGKEMATACGNDSLFKIVEYADLFRCTALDWYDWLHTIQQYLQNRPPMEIFSSNILIAELEAGLLSEKKVAVCLHMAEGQGEAKFEPSLLPFIVYLFFFDRVLFMLPEQIAVGTLNSIHTIATQFMNSCGEIYRRGAADLQKPANQVPIGKLFGGEMVSAEEWQRAKVHLKTPNEWTFTESRGDLVAAHFKAKAELFRKGDTVFCQTHFEGPFVEANSYLLVEALLAYLTAISTDFDEYSFYFLMALLSQCHAYGGRQPGVNELGQAAYHGLMEAEKIRAKRAAGL